MRVSDRSARQRREIGFAKVNLCLQVLDKRPDGYHEVRTLLQSIDLCDRVGVLVWEGAPRSVELACSRKDLENSDNLAWRAAERLLEALGIDARVRIELDKEIPSGAGLGGGSSDAGAVLRALAGLLPGDRPPAGLLHEVASELGSDVPYFLVGGTAIATGRGTQVRSLPDMLAVAIVLALPTVEVPTDWAYKELAERRAAGLTPPAPARTMEGPGSGLAAFSEGAFGSLAEWMRNDFESVVFQRFPALGVLKRRLLGLGAHHAMLSGSGSSVFGIFDSFRAARHAASALTGEGTCARAHRFLGRAGCGIANAGSASSPTAGT